MPNITVRNARIILRNLAGRKTTYKPAGQRSFSLLIEDEAFANDLLNDGWNVKPLKKRDENDEQHWHLSVAVVYGDYPPEIYLVAGRRKTLLNEANVSTIDTVRIQKVDLVINPSHYNINGREGIKAYLKKMYVVIDEDELDREYADYDIPYGDEEDVPF